MKKYQVVIHTGDKIEKILTTTNKAEAEIVYDGYKKTHAVAILTSDMQF